MSTDSLKKMIQVASRAQTADFVIKNCRVVNVFTHEIIHADIAFCDGLIAGVGEYDGTEELDACGAYALPGLIDAHIHIESSMLTPEEFGRIAVPHGTTTIIADPHEITNVFGIKGLEYMRRAAEKTALNVSFMVPSCVPCTEWEDAGAAVNAEDIRETLKSGHVGGMGEFMNAVGVVNTDEEVLRKLSAAHDEGAVIDGHAPGISPDQLAGYMAAGIRTDHECGTVEEMLARLRGGMYVQLRYGSACKELPILLNGLTAENARRCLICSDDRQAATLLHEGEIDENLRICVEHGLDPVTAIQMATLNAAECYGLHDRGAIAPCRRADVVLVNDLKDFQVQRVFIGGELVAEDGAYLPDTERADPGEIGNSMHVADFSVDRLRMKLNSRYVHTIDVRPGTVLTNKGVSEIRLTEDNDFRFSERFDVVRISVIERHHGTGKVANGFLRGYGLKRGAIALSIGHDSHNILTAGISAEEMAFAVEKLIEQKGGIVVTDNGKALHSLPLPIAGLMSDRSAEEVAALLRDIEDSAIFDLGVNDKLDPIITLCFMSLPVIPDLKITDRGLFDVCNQCFIEPEAEKQ